MDDLQGLVDNVVAFANVITPLLPAIMALGPFGFGIALFIFYKFLLLAVEILLGIALWLSLLIDDFQYYTGVNPTEDASDEHPDEQTEGPETECPFELQGLSAQALLKGLGVALSHSDSLVEVFIECIQECGITPATIVDSDIVPDGMRCIISCIGNLFSGLGKWIVILIAVSMAVTFPHCVKYGGALAIMSPATKIACGMFVGSALLVLGIIAFCGLQCALNDD